MEYKGKVFKLYGEGGDNWIDYKIGISNYSSGNSEVEYWCAVVGFERKMGLKDKWGHTSFDDFYPETNIIYKTKYKTVYKSKIKKPKTLLEKIMSKLGFFRKI